jgi:hypothetical protein
MASNRIDRRPRRAESGTTGPRSPLIQASRWESVALREDGNERAAHVLGRLSADPRRIE